eukprot:5411268-Alexandrium_andersonii.AAC.1
MEAAQSPPPQPVQPAGRALVVLSLFDGNGVIWHSLRVLLTRTCLWDRLVAAWSAEIQPHLSDAVVRRWANTRRL